MGTAWGGGNGVMREDDAARGHASGRRNGEKNPLEISGSGVENWRKRKRIVPRGLMTTRGGGGGGARVSF